MADITQRRLELIELAIVDIDFFIQVFRDPNTKKSLVGARRRAVEKVTQLLLEAKRNQIDGLVRLEVKDISLLLQVMALTIEWQAALLFFRLGEDDE